MSERLGFRSFATEIVQFARESYALALEAGTREEVVDLASRLGVKKIIKRPMQASVGKLIDAMLIPTGDSYVIALNQNVSESRQLYSLAHEIGHILIDEYYQNTAGTGEKMRHRLTTSNNSEKHEEQLCQAIAAELLMPSESFSKQVQRLGFSLRNIPALSRQYRTSISATAIRYSDFLPEPSLLVNWRSEERGRGKLRPSWRLRNDVPGPSVELLTSRRTTGRSIFRSAEVAWATEGMHSDYESLLIRETIRSSQFVKSARFRAESMGFGKDKNRFVISVAYLGDQINDATHSIGSVE